MPLKKAPDRPPAMAGLRHVALCVKDLACCQRFYVDLLGYQVEWQPDPNNVYLSCGIDNLALHYDPERANGTEQEKATKGSLDHIGFILAKAEDVDVWYQWLLHHKVSMKKPPKTHRDGARSFYCYDPENHLVQMIYHPPIAGVWMSPLQNT